MKVSISAPRRAALVGLATLAVAGCDRADSPAAAASAAAPGGAYMVPRTPWGDPDLQGKWPSTQMVGVPVQRDEKLGSRNVLNDEEYAEREARAARQTEQDNADFDIESAKNAQVDVRHRRLALPTPIVPVLHAHIRSAGNQSRQVMGIVRGAGAASVQHDRVVHHAAFAVLITVQSLEEVR